ncbi:excalibur calcium-binding domain-containing protein [Microbacterium sp.]|uniref:excalibur calcium-binding domain-containing protein n=1 Tax=Microbacterium sp. TaxID=51671 RepID=UPI00345DF9C8
MRDDEGAARRGLLCSRGKSNLGGDAAEGCDAILYQSGVDPEYAWYQDRDHDGRVCEF